MKMVEVWDSLYHVVAVLQFSLINNSPIYLELLTQTMSKTNRNNSHHNQIRELQYEDELQGYDIKNANRSRKKKVNKMKQYHDHMNWQHNMWQFTKWTLRPHKGSFFVII